MRGELQEATGSNEQHHQRDDALAAFGLVLEGQPDEPEPFYLLPEHLPAVNLWAAAQTQWRMGFDGPTGLDYAGVEALMRQRRERKPHRRFAELQIMESAALAEWRAQRAARR